MENLPETGDMKNRIIDIIGNNPQIIQIRNFKERYLCKSVQSADKL